MNTDLTDLPAPPTSGEVWWVAVEDTPDPSGGWIVLADPGDAGAHAIAGALTQAGVAFLAATSAADLERAIASLGGLPTLAFRASNHQMIVSHHADPPAQVLLELRLLHPFDRIVMVEDTAQPKALLDRLTKLVDSTGFEGVRLDLRTAPRGQGAWGLAMALIR